MLNPPADTKVTDDDELIKHALDAKKLEVLGKIEDMIKDATTKSTKSNKKRN